MKTRTLLLAWLAAVVAALALPAVASATNPAIYGDYIEYHSNGAGLFDTFFYAHHGGSNSSMFGYSSYDAGDADAGIALTILSADGTSATTYGLHGQPFTPYTAPHLLNPSATGSAADPYILSTSYVAGAYDEAGNCTGNPCIKVTENAEYGYDDPNSQAADDVSMKYHVDNEGTQPVRFRLTAAADVKPGYDEGGRGYHVPSGPEIVGTGNAASGAIVSFQESGLTPWTHYQEDVPYEIWDHVEHPLTSGSLADSFEPTYSDKAIAVEWDNHEAAVDALAAGGAGADFHYLLLFKDSKTFSIDDPHGYSSPAFAEVGATATLTTTTSTPDATLNDSPVRWRLTYGPNSAGYYYQPYARVTTTAAHATLSWQSSGPIDTQNSSYYYDSYDEAYAFADFNDNGVQDPDEPGDYRAYYWYDPIQLDTYDSYARTGTDNYVTVALKDSTGAPQSVPFKYRVSGVNPQSDGSEITHNAIVCDPIAGPCSYPNIPLTGVNPGYDVVDVWADLNADGDDSDPGEHRRTTVRWYSLLSTSPTDQEVDTGTSATVNVTLDTDGGATAGTVLKYKVEGANAVAQTDTSPTVAGYYGDSHTTISVPGSSTGTSLVTVWQEIDLTPGPTAGDQIARSTLDWVAPAAQRFTFTPQYATKTTGNATSVTANVMDFTGAAGDTTPRTIRYEIDGPDGFSGWRTVQSDNTGHATIPLAGPGVGTDQIDGYVDYNNDTVRQSNEPYAYTDIDFVKPVIFDYYGTYDDQYQTASIGASTTLYPFLRGTDSVPLSGQSYDWSVISGPNVGQGANGLLTGTGLGAGRGTITYTGSNTPGTDIVQVTFTGTDGPHSGTIKVHWKQSLTLARNAADLSTNATGVVTATLKNSTTNAPAPAGTVLVYDIGNNNGPKKVGSVKTDVDGHATISFVGTNAGSTYVTAWPDYDHDGENDYDTEPSASTSITFHERVELTSNTSTVRPQGNTKSVTATFRDDNYQPLTNHQLKYIITGPNAVAAPAVMTDSLGKATITWTGTETTDFGAGPDRLTVFEDTNSNDLPDANEHQSPVYTQYWSNRLDLTSSYYSNLDTGTSTSRTFKLYNLDGTTGTSGALLRWQITGANPQSGTATTDGSGNATISWTGNVGGSDSLSVFHDANNNGSRDAGEPLDNEAVAYWITKVLFSPTNPTAKYQGLTQDISVTKGFGAPAGNLRYRVYGPNATNSDQNVSGGTVTLTGTNAGTDELFAYIDANSNNQYDGGELSGWCYMTWNNRLAMAGGLGGHVAGGHVNVTVTLLDSTGAAVTGSPTDLKYSISGANPASLTTVSTSNTGSVAIGWDGVQPGTDTLTVFKDDNLNNQWDSGEFKNTRNVYWSPPPVQLTLGNVGGNSALQGNTHDVTATVSGVTIPGAGFPIHYTITGANPTSGTVQTNASGVATIQWTGNKDGVDSVSAYADVSGATGVDDAYDPNAGTSFTWTPLIEGSATTSDQVAGELHTETIHISNPNGTPAVNVAVLYTISGANPTTGTLEARPISAGPATISKRTDGSGNTTISWSGTNPAGGTDTLDAYGDTNANGIVDAADPHTTRTVAWRTATAASTGGTGTTTPIGTVSQVTPGSPEDIDGLPTPPPPVVAKAVNVAPVSGRVFVKLPGKNKFIELLDAEQIPVGSIVDVLKGRVALTSAQNLKGGVATADFYKGQFQIAQKKAAKPITDLTLVGGNFKPCGKIASKSALGLAAQKKKVRELWGSGKGLFRTKGKYAAAAIRGTTWDVVDYCDGTLVKVTEGLVTVTDTVKHKNITLKAKKTYFASARKRG